MLAETLERYSEEARALFFRRPQRYDQEEAPCAICRTLVPSGVREGDTYIPTCLGQECEITACEILVHARQQDACRG